MNKFIALLFVVLLIVSTAILISLYNLLPDWQTRGQFGDMFGTINALFSGFALIGVIVAIILQKKELELQRKELEYTREELRRTAEAHEQSKQALFEQVTLMKDTAILAALTSIVKSYADEASSLERMGATTDAPIARNKEYFYMKHLVEKYREVSGHTDLPTT